MDAMKFLEQWVVQDGKSIDVRLLSMLLNIHISVAHENMKQFYEETSRRGNDSMPFTLWIVKGLLKADPANIVASQSSSDSMDVDDEKAKPTMAKESMLLVAQDKLEETESKFERIDVKEVYSFSPRLPGNFTTAHKVAAISQLTTIQHDLHSKKEYTDVWESTERGVQLGTIRAAQVWKDAGKPDIPESKAGSSSKSISSKVAPVVKKEAVEVTKPISKAVPKKEGLDWSKSKSTDKAKTKAKPSNPKSKRKLVESDEEDDSAHESSRPDSGEEEEDAGPIGYANEIPKRADAGDNVSAEEEKRRRRKQELLDMMEEDADGKADPHVAAGESTTTSMMRGTEDESKEKKEDEGEQNVNDEKEAGNVPQNGSKRRVKKHRKIIKKQTTKDAKGYRKTVDVEEYESYSSDESDTPLTGAPPKAAAAATAKAAPDKKEIQSMARTNSANNNSNNNAAKKSGGGTGPAGGQRKLSSFFTKG